MNLPNILTLSRIPLMVIVAALLHQWQGAPIPWASTAAFLLFLFGALTDWLDGWLARKLGQVSEFGKFMDALVDKIFTMGLFVSLLTLGVIGLWALFPVLLILAREFLITGLRLVAAAQGKTLAAEKAGKIKTGFQIACISFFLGEGAVLHDWTPWLGSEMAHKLGSFLELLGQGTLVIACMLTVISGSIYLYKYWDFFLCEESSD